MPVGRTRMLDMLRNTNLGNTAPPGASESAVGTDAVPTPELGGGPGPRAAEEPEGQTAAQNAIMQAVAGGGQPQAPQLTPEDEEILKARLAMAARQRLLGGLP